MIAILLCQIQIYSMRFTFYCAILLFISTRLSAHDSAGQRVNLHFQTTYIYQYKPEFSAKYSGGHSIQASEDKENSLTATMYLGVRLWKGAEIYLNPEVAGGSGLSGAFGMAGSTNGETFRVGDPAPTVYIARGYLKQTIDLSREREAVEDNANQLAGNEPQRYLRLYAGKFSLGDFFDNNNYANGPRTQFINWGLMSNTAWDYAANLRGYTAGFMAIYRDKSMTYKICLAALPKVANGSELNMDYGMARGINAEVTKTYLLHKKEGHVRLLAYRNETNMGDYKQALTTLNTGLMPDVVLTEKNGRTKTGWGINADQQLSEVVGVFARAGWNDGKTETWAFTEADRTISAGVSVNGKRWKRGNDNIGFGVVMNGISADHKNYLAAGGYGFQLGDGHLNYASELITEMYYSYKPLVNSGIWLSGDYQFAMHPGYNKDRGPLQVLSFRLHVEL